MFRLSKASKKNETIDISVQRSTKWTIVDKIIAHSISARSSLELNHITAISLNDSDGKSIRKRRLPGIIGALSHENVSSGVATRCGTRLHDQPRRLGNSKHM